MLTLHKVIEESRLLFKWGIAVFVAFIALVILIRVGASMKERFFPTPPLSPTVSFGKLPSIEFPQSVTNKKLVFTIDTLPGTLPHFSNNLAVYKIEEKQQNLLALRRAKERVLQAGFTSDGTPVSDSLYRWDTPDGSKTLLLDILSLNYTYTLNPITKDGIYAKSTIRDTATAIAKTESFMTGLTTIPSDRDTNKTTAHMLTYKDSALKEATSVSNTQVIRVDFFQKDIDSIPLFYPNPPMSTVYAIVAGNSSNPIITESKFFHLTISTQATYPIKTTEEAFTQLQRDSGYIASWDTLSESISIKNIYLGYFASNDYQPFLMPIFVFEGKDGFFAYVSAVQEEWIKK